MGQGCSETGEDAAPTGGAGRSGMESARDAAERGEGVSGSWRWHAGPVQQGEKAGCWRARAAGLVWVWFLLIPFLSSIQAKTQIYLNSNKFEFKLLYNQTK